MFTGVLLWERRRFDSFWSLRAITHLLFQFQSVLFYEGQRNLRGLSPRANSTFCVRGLSPRISLECPSIFVLSGLSKEFARAKPTRKHIMCSQAKPAYISLESVLPFSFCAGFKKYNQNLGCPIHLGCAFVVLFPVFASQQIHICPRTQHTKPSQKTTNTSCYRVDGETRRVSIREDLH